MRYDFFKMCRHVLNKIIHYNNNYMGIYVSKIASHFVCVCKCICEGVFIA